MFEQEAVDAGVAGGVGARAAFAKTDLFGELEGQWREIEPGRASLEQSARTRAAISAAEIEEGSMPAIVAGNAEA